MFVKYAFLAESTLIDGSGKVSAMQIFDVILASQFPAVRRDMTLVAQLEGTPGEAGDHNVSVELRDDEANVLAKIELPIGMSSSKVVHGIFRSGVIVQMHDIVFKKAGHYEYVMFLDKRFLGRVTFTVQKVQARGT
jgi:hypothetical protein